MSAPTLRPYQSADADRIEAALSSTQSVLYVLPTGGGKTTVYQSLAARETARGGSVVILADREELIRQAHDRIGGRVIMGSYRPTPDVQRPDSPGVTIASVATLARRSEAPDATRVFADEAHLYAADSFRRVLSAYRDSGAKIIGGTATPARLDGQGFGCLFDSVVQGPSAEELIRLGFLVPVDHRAPTGEWWDAVHLSGGDFDTAELEAASSAVLRDIAGRWRELGGAVRPTLVFAVNKAHARKLAAEFDAHLFLLGLPPCEIVTDDTPAPVRRSVRDRIQAGALRVVVTVGVLGTGFDAPAVSCLDDETEVLTPKGWRGIDDRIDAVIALDTREGKLAVTAVEARTESSRTELVSLKSGQFDLRVTPDHRMLVGTGRRHTAARWTTADALVDMERFRLPVSGGSVNDVPLPLSDDELRLIAWFTTDGGWNKAGSPGRGIRIAQSKPHMVVHIRGLLARLGLAFREYVRTNQRGLGGAEALLLHIFDIPFGVRGRSKGRGFAQLVQFMDKQLAAALLGMSREQFVVFWEECLLGDGDGNSRPGRAQQLCVADGVLLANLQALASMCGFATNATVRTLPSGKPFWLMSLSKRRFIEIKPRDSRRELPSVIRERTPATRVWCVQNRLGTLVVRRNGSVAVVGNCVVMARPTLSWALYLQQGGRGLRPWPATGKRDLLLVDCAGNTLRHGYLTAPFAVSLDGPTRKHRRATAGLTTCRKCFRIYEWTLPACPKCGQVKPRGAERRVREVDGQLVELTGAQQWAERAATGQQIRKLAAWIREGEEKGWKPAAPLARFKGTFRRWPSREELEQARKAASA